MSRKTSLGLRPRSDIAFFQRGSARTNRSESTKSVAKTAGWTPGFGVHDSMLRPARSTTASTRRFCLRSYTWARAFLVEVPSRTDRLVGSLRLTYGKKAPRGHWPYDSITWNVALISATVSGSSGPAAKGAAASAAVRGRIGRDPAPAATDVVSVTTANARTIARRGRFTDTRNLDILIPPSARARVLADRFGLGVRLVPRRIRRSRVAEVCTPAFGISRACRDSTARPSCQAEPWRARWAASRS